MWEHLVAERPPWAYQFWFGVVLATLLLLFGHATTFAQSPAASPAITTTEQVTPTQAVTVGNAPTMSVPILHSLPELTAGGMATTTVGAPTATPATPGAAVAPAAQQGEVIPLDKLCIQGAVINFDETPLTDGWRITAIKLDANAQPIPGSQLITVSDRNGKFRFVLGPRDIGAWRLVMQAKDGYQAVTPDDFVVLIQYGRSDCLKVRFKERPQIEVTVLVTDDAENPQANWLVRAEPGEGNRFAGPVEQRTAADGRVLFSFTPGLWRFSEQAPAGVSYTAVSPANGTQEIDLTTPGPYTISFKNRIDQGTGCIDIHTLDGTPGHEPLPLAGWLVELRGADGAPLTSARTAANGVVRFGNLPPGAYQVIEELQPGWTPLTPGGFGVTVVGGVACSAVEFLNAQQSPAFCIEGRVVDANGKIGLPGWTITLQPLDPNGFQPEPVSTDGEGTYKLVLPESDSRIPGAQYQVCAELQTGWLALTPTCYTVILAKEVGLCRAMPDFENEQVGHSARSAAVAGCRATHLVQPNEGLFAIGNAYGVSAQAMLAANPWVRKRPHCYLRVNDQVCIPPAD
jgi:hypothetical protein